MSMEDTIFKGGSTTYYWSSRFFPKHIREDVFKLYSFVRIADDYVDAVPQEAERFHELRASWMQACEDKSFDTKPNSADTVDERVIKNIIFVVSKYEFEQAWIESFFDSMQADLDQKKYKSIEDTLWYVYGSAEVIGLMMAKIMGLPQEAQRSAMMQGRAMQFINFIRDIAEDNSFSRQYIPQDDLDVFGLEDLSVESARRYPEAFTKLIQYELSRYDAWQLEANTGFRYIPRRLLVPLRTAVDMYNWTGSQISKNPIQVFDTKIKPSRAQVIATILKNTVS